MGELAEAGRMMEQGARRAGRSLCPHKCASLVSRQNSLGRAPLSRLSCKRLQRERAKGKGHGNKLAKNARTKAEHVAAALTRKRAPSVRVRSGRFH